MARSPIEIALASETKAFKQGIEAGVIKPLEDAIKKLRDLGDTDGADQLEAQLRDAQKATERLGDETKITAARIDREYRDASRKAKSSLDDVGDAGKKGFGKAGEASSEFKGEALANLSEVTSAFDGSLESIGDLVQGTLGGVAANLPVIGIAAAGAAAAVGTITEAFTKAGEATDEARDSAYQYGLTVASVGEYADVTGRINELTGSVEGLKRVQDIAAASGWAQLDVVKAMATGDGLPALFAAFEEGANTTGIATGRMLELEGALQGAQQGFDLAKSGADLQATALYDMATAAGVASGEVDDLGNKVVTMPDGKKVVIDAATKTAYEDIDALERRPIADKTMRLRLDSSEWDNWYPGAKVGKVRVAVGQGGGGGITWEG